MTASSCKYFYIYLLITNNLCFALSITTSLFLEKQVTPEVISASYIYKREKNSSLKISCYGMHGWGLWQTPEDITLNLGHVFLWENVHKISLKQNWVYSNLSPLIVAYDCLIFLWLYWFQIESGFGFLTCCLS